MSDGRNAETLTGGEVALLLQATGVEIASSSPLLPLAEMEPSQERAAIEERGLLSEAWMQAIGVLADPGRQIRCVVPAPSETAVFLFYGTRSDPGEGLVGCWLDEDGVGISFPWSEGDVIAESAAVILGSPPPLGTGQRLSLSIGGLYTLAAAVDTIRDRLFSSLLERDPSVKYHFDRDRLAHALAAETQGNDARSVVTLFRILGSPYVAVSPADAETGLDELAAAGLVEVTDGRWKPQAPLLELAAQWRNPLPAVAHEVIEVGAAGPERCRHRIAIRGEGPLWIIDYGDLLSPEITVTMESMDAADYLDGLHGLLQRLPADGDICVRHSTDVLDSAGTVVGRLEPGRAYPVLETAPDWVCTRDAAGIEGWVPRDRVMPAPVKPAPRVAPPAAEQPAVAPAPSAPSAMPPWAPTHQAPADGMAAWSAPDPAAAPTTTLAAGTPLGVVEHRGDWVHVRAENGWEAWVDGRRLAQIAGRETAPEAPPLPPIDELPPE